MSEIPAHLLDRSRARARLGITDEVDKPQDVSTFSVMTDALNLYKRALEATAPLVETDEDSARFVAVLRTVNELLLSLKVVDKLEGDIKRLLEDLRA